MPESLHWLVSQQRFADAQSLAEEAAKVNGIILPEKLDLNQEDKVESATKNRKTLWDVAQTPLLRVYAAMMFFMWYAFYITGTFQFTEPFENFIKTLSHDKFVEHAL